MRSFLIAVMLLTGAPLLAADACYYGNGKSVCMERTGDTVSFRGGEPMRLTGEMGIRFRDGTTERMRDAILKKYGLTPVAVYADWPVYVKVKVPQGSDGFRLSRMLVESGSVKWAQPIWIQKVEFLSTVPNDTFYTDQSWHHEMIHSPEAWDITTGDPRAVIAIVDTGVDTQHPDLWPNLLIGASFVPTENYVDPNMGSLAGYQAAHGTAVAGLATAKGNNGMGVAGVCWDCGLLPIKYSGGSELGFPNDRKFNAMKWAVDNGAWVINNSWKIMPDTKEDENGSLSCITVAYDNYVTESINYAFANGRGGRGTVILFASGNSGCTTDLNENFQTDDLVVVSALAATGAIDSYSNYGPATDIGSPAGYDLTIDMRGLTTTDSTLAGKGYNPHYAGDLPDQSYTKFFSGTSGAAPQVTAAVAMMLSVAPYLTAAEAIGCLKSSASAPTQGCKYGDPALCYGAGVLNVQAMVENAKNGTCGGTPECSGPDDCGDGKECWNGICVEGGTVSDNDVIPDDTIPDETVTDDQLPDDQMPDDQTPDDQPDLSEAEGSDQSDPPDTTVVLDEMVTDDAINPVNEDDGCGCSLI